MQRGIARYSVKPQKKRTCISPRTVLETIEPELVAYKKYDRTLHLKRRTRSYILRVRIRVCTRKWENTYVPMVHALLLRYSQTSKPRRERARGGKGGRFEEEGPLDDSTARHSTQIIYRQAHAHLSTVLFCFLKRKRE